jgi:hypothetical protein
VLVTAVGFAPARAAQEPATATPWRVEYGFVKTETERDVEVLAFSAGLLLRRGSAEIFAQEGVLELDVDATRAAAAADDAPVPRRSVPAPDPRRVTTAAEIERRFASFLAAAGQRPPQRADVPAPTGRELYVSALRTLYLHGDVSVRNGGVEMLRASSLLLSILDDRMVMRDVELRLPSRDPDSGAMRYVTLRGAQLIRQGTRTTGRDVSVTTSIAAAPHFEFVGGEVELIERGDEFEVRGRDNKLLVHGSKITALPDLDFFTSQQPPFPLKGLAGGYGSKEGVRAEVQLGGTWNRLGGSLHETLTGDDRAEFRGHWRANLGFNQERGFPLEGELGYRGGDLYRGRVRAFYLDDQGRNRGPIQNDLDGARIDERDRQLVRTDNRVFLGEATSLDLELFHASDAAVFPEFYSGEWLETELPETRAHLRHARDNWIGTLSGRFDIDGAAYRDDRTLAPRFLEERPYGTFDVFAQPLFALSDGVPLLLTSSTSAGELRFDYDRLAPTPLDEEAVRVDQHLELAAPFAAGVLAVRPFVFGRLTYYDDSPSGEDVTRVSYGGGVRAGTRLQRTWQGLGTAGADSLRHVMHPEVAVLHYTRASKAPADVFQFDDVDTLDEDVTVRVGVLNRIETARRAREGEAADVHEPIWLDLAQNFKPLSRRDNGGEVLGLTEYEFILRPGINWPVPNWRLFVEGEYDTRAHDHRTFNAGTEFGKVLGIDWSVEYREDRVRDGVLLGSGHTTLWHRWAMSAGTAYDLERDDTLNYFASLTRHDLDWTARVGIVYDTLNDETAFFIRFEPTLGGFVTPSNRELTRGLRAWGSTLQGY